MGHCGDPCRQFHGFHVAGAAMAITFIGAFCRGRRVVLQTDEALDVTSGMSLYTLLQRRQMGFYNLDWVMLSELCLCVVMICLCIRYVPLRSTVNLHKDLNRMLAKGPSQLPASYRFSEVQKGRLEFQCFFNRVPPRSPPMIHA